MNNSSGEGTSLLHYKGSVSGLKGLLTNNIAKGLANVVNTIDKIREEVAATDPSASVERIALDKIYPNPEQPRQVFEARSLEELSHTMKELGQAQAITVRKTGIGYEIIAGERRYRAAKLAGLTHLDCVIKDVSPKEARLLALVENIQRQDLLPIEESQFLKRILNENPDFSLDKLAKVLGSHKSTLSEKIQLTEVPEDLQQLLFNKGRNFTHRHWRVISRIEDASFLRTMMMQALEHQMSVAELERSLQIAGVKKAPRKKPKATTSESGSSHVLTVEELEKFDLVKKDGHTFRIQALTIEADKVPATARDRLIRELEDLILSLKIAAPARRMDIEPMAAAPVETNPKEPTEGS